MNLNIPLKFPLGDINPDQLPVAIYVHGLASGANGTTYNQLAKRFEQFRWITTDFDEDALLGRANYAIFSAHDELLGEVAAAQAQRVLDECGYRIVIDPKGHHRMQSSTLRLIEKEVLANECFGVK